MFQDLRNKLTLLFTTLLVFGCSTQPSESGHLTNTTGITGTVEVIPALASEFVLSRQIEVWLPPGYADSDKRYPVLYMLDGQNVFNPATSTHNTDWGVDETMQTLVTQQKIRPAIVVAIWSTDQRIPEYVPLLAEESVAHTRYLAEEVVPYIEGQYRTLTGASNTFVMGSSLGGLMALYALAEYPDKFGGAAGVSTHWSLFIDYPGADHLKYIEESAVNPYKHKLYFDYGTMGLDEKYEPLQLDVNQILETKGYVQGETLMSLKFDGHTHSESSWRDRVHIPLQFLLGS